MMYIVVTYNCVRYKCNKFFWCWCLNLKLCLKVHLKLIESSDGGDGRGSVAIFFELQKYWLSVKTSKLVKNISTSVLYVWTFQLNSILFGWIPFITFWCCSLSSVLCTLLKFVTIHYVYIIAAIMSNVEYAIWFYVTNHFQNVKLLHILKSYRQSLPCSMVTNLGLFQGLTVSLSLVRMYNVWYLHQGCTTHGSQVCGHLCHPQFCSSCNQGNCLETIQLLGTLPPYLHFWGLCPPSGHQTIALELYRWLPSPRLHELACRLLKIWNAAVHAVQVVHRSFTVYLYHQQKSWSKIAWN